MNSESKKNSTYNPEIINQKAWLIVDSAGSIKFSNQVFHHLFKLDKGSNLNEIKFEPDLHNVITKLSENKLSGFSSVFIYEADNKIINYKIEIEKVKLFNSPYYIIVFNPEEGERFIEDKISNLHFALEYGKVPVIIFDNKGIVSFATNSFEKILDFELDVIYNSHISKILSNNLSSEKIDRLEAAIEAGKHWSETISLSLIDEQPFHFELTLNPIFNESGKILNFVLTAHDISYYIIKNQVTKKSENQLKQIVNNISDLLIILKQSNDFIYFEHGNDDFLKEFKLDKNSILLKKYEEVLPKELANKIKEEISYLQRRMELQCKFAFNYEEKFYSCRIVIIGEDNLKEKLFVISLKDITDEEIKKEQLKKLYRKEQQLSRLKTTFLQNMSHEIRTPFTAIMGYSDIMVDCIEEKDFDTVVEITDSLKSVLTRVMNLFENILEVSEIETDEVHLDLVTMNCNQILKAVHTKKLKEAKLNGVEIELDLDSEDYLCKIDWIKFERIILNLVDNSIKYSNNGKIKISSRTTEEYVTITITDSGVGINETVISRLLEPFVQEEPDGHLRNYEGAGLGLTIAYEYTKLMNGEMNIKSTKNVGTEIFLNFPRQKHLK